MTTMNQKICVICSQAFPAGDDAPEHYVCAGCTTSLPDLSQRAAMKIRKAVIYRVEVPQFEGGVNLEHEVARLERATAISHRKGWLTFAGYRDLDVTVPKIMIEGKRKPGTPDPSEMMDQEFSGRFGHVSLLSGVNPAISEEAEAGRDVLEYARTHAEVTMADVQLVPEGKIGRALIGLRKAVEEGVFDGGLDASFSDGGLTLPAKPREIAENYIRRYCDMPVTWSKVPAESTEFIPWAEGEEGTW